MIGIIGAVIEEAEAIKKEIKDIKENIINGISFFTGKFKIFSTLLYLFMGWMIVFSWGELRANISNISLAFLIAGGILYSLGTIFYMWKICKYNHMIWHIFVIMGSISHFFAVYYLV